MSIPRQTNVSSYGRYLEALGIALGTVAIGAAVVVAAPVEIAVGTVAGAGFLAAMALGLLLGGGTGCGGTGPGPQPRKPGGALPEPPPEDTVSHPPNGDLQTQFSPPRNAFFAIFHAEGITSPIGPDDADPTTPPPQSEPKTGCFVMAVDKGSPLEGPSSGGITPLFTYGKWAMRSNNPPPAPQYGDDEGVVQAYNSYRTLRDARLGGDRLNVLYQGYLGDAEHNTWESGGWDSWGRRFQLISDDATLQALGGSTAFVWGVNVLLNEADLNRSRIKITQGTKTPEGDFVHSPADAVVLPLYTRMDACGAADELAPDPSLPPDQLVDQTFTLCDNSVAGSECHTLGSGLTKLDVTLKNLPRESVEEALARFMGATATFGMDPTARDERVVVLTLPDNELAIPPPAPTN